MHTSIDVNTTDNRRLFKHEEQKQLIRDYNKQELVDQILLDDIVGNIDLKYLKACNIDYTPVLQMRQPEPSSPTLDNYGA